MKHHTHSPFGFCLARAATLSLLIHFIATFPLLSAPRGSKNATLERLQGKYDALTAFQADFTQRYHSRVLNQIRIEKGTIYLLKPGKMRWVYKSPVKKLFIADGETTYFYVPEDNQVVVEAVGTNETTIFPFLFLGGQERIEDHFEVQVAEPAERKRLRLNMVLKTGEPQYHELSVVFERPGLVLQKIEYLDQNDNETTITFSNVEENPVLADELFRFLIPPGVEVLRSEQENSSLLLPSRVRITSLFREWRASPPQPPLRSSSAPRTTAHEPSTSSRREENHPWSSPTSSAPSGKSSRS